MRSSYFIRKIRREDITKEIWAYLKEITVWMPEFIQLRLWSSVGLCEHRKGHSDSIKCENFLAS
jgi:hypothetical protein